MEFISAREEIQEMLVEIFNEGLDDLNSWEHEFILDNYERFEKEGEKTEFSPAQELKINEIHENMLDHQYRRHMMDKND